jgi:colicin import membrane protein
MDLKQLQRTAVDRYLRVARAPLDLVDKVVVKRNGDDGAASPDKLAADRADAFARRIAGTVLRDDELLDDARRREQAAATREDAIELRAAAERKRREADAKFQQQQRAARNKKVTAAEQAAAQKEQVEERTEARKRQVAQKTTRKKAAARKTADRRKEAIDERATKTRLRELDREAEVLAQEEKAVAAKQRASRLEDAAAATKAVRKAT